MAVTWYTQSGTPADATGVDGDMSFDYTNRIQWGPRGQKTAGSWTGTAVNAVGPTGPGVLSGTGAPASSLGQTGNMYVDATQGNTYTKGASSWSLVGTLPAGPIGPVGFTSMPNATMVNGPQLYANGVSVSTTPYVFTYPSGSIAQPFSPLTPSALLGVGCRNNGTAVTIELYDQTTSKSVWTGSMSSAQDYSSAVFASGTYPLTAGDIYVWRMTATASGTTSTSICPYYLMPSTAALPAISPLQGFQSATGTALSSTAKYIDSFGISGSKNRQHYFVRTGSLYNMTVTYVPASGTTSSSSVTCAVAKYNFSSNTSSTVYTSGAVSANSTPTTFGPFTPGTYSAEANSSIAIGLTGSGTGQIFVDMNWII